MLTDVARETTQLKYAGATSDVARNVLKLGASDVLPDVRGSALKAVIVVVAPPQVEKYRSLKPDRGVMTLLL